MKAEVGDWLVIKGATIDQPDQRGLITEVHSPDGSPPYVVRWLDTAGARGGRLKARQASS
jgi:hypothetical protein